VDAAPLDAPRPHALLRQDGSERALRHGRRDDRAEEGRPIREAEGVEEECEAGRGGRPDRLVERALRPVADERAEHPPRAHRHEEREQPEPEGIRPVARDHGGDDRQHERDRAQDRCHRPPHAATLRLTVDGIGTGRLEAFSNGVFAIAATLLILEIGVDTSRGDLGGQLTHIWPSYLAYVTTFLIIGIIWLNHHHCVSLIGRVDRTFLFVNLLLLLTVSFMPFPTKLVAQYLQKPDEKPAVIAYAATMTLMAAIYNVWWRYARTNRRLIADRTTDTSLEA